jgi:hypothetical protein
MAVNEIELARAKDQFYTKPAVAKACYQRLQDFLADNEIKAAAYLEPCAGKGSFFDLLPPGARLGFDLEPKAKGVLEGDFFDQWPKGDNWITVGNPPFGKNASLALRFFNHAASFSQIIAMIFPRTFMKTSLQNRLDLRFHLVDEEVLPLNSFELLGQDYEVSCVFQIWQRRLEPRVKVQGRMQHADFEFVSREQADFAIQRVGVNAGRVKDVTDKIATPSHYFIKGSPAVRATFERMDQEQAYQSVKYNTAGNPSIGKDELIGLWEKNCG